MAIIELVLRYTTDCLIESLSDQVLYRHRYTGLTFLSINNLTLPQMLGAPAASFRKRLTPDSALMRSGLLRIDPHDGELLLPRVKRLAFKPFEPSEDVFKLLFDVAPKTELEWQDYDHVGRARDHVESLVRGALGARATGVNVLLYGPHGTGKTEFCKVLGERLGVPVYSIGECDEDGDMPDGDERLEQLLLAQRVLGDHGNSILLLDEMDDVLSESKQAWMFGVPSAASKRDALQALLR